MHKLIPSFSFKGTVTRPRSSSSSSSSRVTIPCLSSAALRDGSYQPGRAYHTTHVDRLNFAAERAAWGIEGRWGPLQFEARHGTLSDLFPDLGESTYENWDLQQGDVLLAFMNHGPLPSQELHEALKEAHETIGLEADERVRLREEIPAIDALSTKHQEAQAAADFNAERARLAEWDAGRSVEGERSGGARGFGPLQPAGYKPR